MNGQPVLILGAKSDIARALAHEFARRGHALQLAARQAQALEADKTDLELRYRVPVSLHEFDVLHSEKHLEFAKSLPALPEIVLCVVGYMGDQAQNQDDSAAMMRVMRSNYEGPAHILSLFATQFEARGHGTLVGISSVAGDRGRAKNYVYGSAKAGFTAFLSGLRNRLAAKGVHVLTVLPGFVATQMTEGMDLPARLTAQPDEVAQAIARAVAARKDVIYTKGIWWLIMLIIRNIPERIFKRMKI